MWVQPVDYLRILEGGYFLHFVAMAMVPADMISLVTTSGFRFKVIIDCFSFRMKMSNMCRPSYMAILSC